MIYDCFTFFNELDLLEIRLNILDKFVDKFVLVEMNQTFAGNGKSFVFEQNKERFKQFLDKIIYIKVSDCPVGNPWEREVYQRNQISKGLEYAKDNDIILVSDLDEIPNPNVLKSYSGGICVCRQYMMYYYINNICITDPYWYAGTRICFYKIFKNSPYKMYYKSNAPTKAGTAQYLRMCTGKIIKNGGWHFSYLGGLEAISNKIKNFSHQEFNNTDFTDLNQIKLRVEHGKDLFDRPKRYALLALTSFFPSYIVQNREKYKTLFYIKDFMYGYYITKYYYSLKLMGIKLIPFKKIRHKLKQKYLSY